MLVFAALYIRADAPAIPVTAMRQVSILYLYLSSGAKGADTNILLIA